MNKNLLVFSLLSLIFLALSTELSLKAQDDLLLYPDSYVTLPNPILPLESDNPEVENVGTYTIKGEITRIDGENLFVKENEMTRSVRVSSGTSITIDDKNSNLSDLYPGFQAEITVTQDTNDVVAIDATSKTMQDSNQNILLGLAALLIVGAILFIARASQRGSISTRASI